MTRRLLSFVAAYSVLLCVANAASGGGICSWYGASGEIPAGARTACGNIFDRNAMATAHPSLPCGTRLRVTNSASGKSVVVTVTDRGPFVAGRVLDLTMEAFKVIEPNLGKGLIKCSFVKI